MDMTLKHRDSRMAEFAATALCVLMAAAYLTLMAHYMPTSKIEEGTVVQRNDSVTTVIIPDIR